MHRILSPEMISCLLLNKCWQSQKYLILGKTTVSVLHDAQLLLNKQQQIWSVVYIL